jgi:hypothetical protein
MTNTRLYFRRVGCKIHYLDQVSDLAEQYDIIDTLEITGTKFVLEPSSESLLHLMAMDAVKHEEDRILQLRKDDIVKFKIKVKT